MGFRLKRVGRALIEASWGGHVSQRVERASEWAGRALEAAGRASEAAGRASEAAGRASEATGGICGTHEPLHPHITSLPF